jgi:hypothetical protein
VKTWSSILQVFHLRGAVMNLHGRTTGLLLVAGLFLGGMLKAQEITVTNAVISIPEGIMVTTGGGITLEEKGAIANHGTLELKGDWTNNGEGLVFTGDLQEIGGTKATVFHDLAMIGEGTKELAADIIVAGRFHLTRCALITNHHTFSLLDVNPLNHFWVNGLVLYGQPETLEAGGWELQQASLPGIPGGKCMEATAPAGATTSTVRNHRSGKCAAQAIPAQKAVNYSYAQHLSTSRPVKAGDVILNGATAAIHTMYFASEMQDVDRFVAILGNTRMLDDDSAPAFSFSAMHINEIHQA